jgi:type I restriction-modification system DNA methylase subunit
MDYSSISKELTNKISKQEKKDDGIYFTPPSCVIRTLHTLEPFIRKMTNVIEPSCGSGEYITAIQRIFPHLQITAIEKNPKIYESIQNLHIILLNQDFLQYKTEEKFDLIIGNPPFYVMKKEEVPKEYYPYFEGRPNIFILFIIHSLKLLKDGGILSFVLPKNFLNCLYYDKTRKYIHENFQILHIIDCKNDKYLETQQDTIVLNIQKKIEIKNETNKINNKNFVLENHNYTLFVEEENLVRLKSLYKDSKSLWELGFKVSVGNVVWNQCKDILTEDSTKTRLIYSSDIQNNSFNMKSYKNEEKKNYIDKPGINRPMIIINRGYGIGEYKFNFCLIDEKKEYLVENHLICIESKQDIPYKELLESFQKIICSLKDERTDEFIRIYFGNNAMNTTELNHILPIYDI